MPHVHLNKTTSPNGKSYWQARWTTPDGSRRCKGLGDCSEVSKTEATRKCRLIERDHASVARKESIGAFRDTYLASSPVCGASVENRRRVLALLVEHMGQNKPIASVTREEAGAFVDWLRARTVRKTVKGKVIDAPVDANTIVTQVSIVRGFFAEALARDLVGANPFDRVKAKKVKKDRFVRMLSAAEFASILDACPSPQWRCMFALCRWAGLRAGETRRVRWEDVRWDKGTLAVSATDADEQVKAHDTKHRERHPPMVPELVAELQRCYDTTDGTGPCDGVSAQPSRWGKTFVKRAGCPPYGEVFQALRSMLVTDWQEKYPALAVARWVGHDVKIAAQHYYQPSDDLVRSVTGTAIILPHRTEKENAAR